MLCERVIKSLWQGLERSLSFRAFKTQNFLHTINKQVPRVVLCKRNKQSRLVGFEERSLSFIEDNQ